MTGKWPTKGDQLFKSDGDWQYSAGLAFTRNQTCYAMAYKIAGDLLVKNCNRKGTRSYPSLLAYPIVFLYRQCIELQLKEIIQNGNKLLHIRENISKYQHHKIDKLWKQCRSIIERLWPKGPACELDAIEESICQFSKIDPNSEAFRYPTGKDGNTQLPASTFINLKNFSDVMDRIARLLDGIITDISHSLECRDEMENS